MGCSYGNQEETIVMYIAYDLQLMNFYFILYRPSETFFVLVLLVGWRVINICYKVLVLFFGLL